MSIRWYFVKRTMCAGLAAVLLAALALSFSPQPAYAATITISNQASCEALGGEIIDPACRFYVPLNIASGDVLEILMPVQLARESTFAGIVNIRSGGTLAAYLEATNNGTINVEGGGKLQNIAENVFTNNGVINVACSGVVVGTISGNPWQYDPACAPPGVTINQASGQADPTDVSPIHFDVVFSEAVSGFTGSDVNLSGTAGATTAVVSGGPTTYDVAVSGMTNDGTVVATIAANAATSAAGRGNTASTSSDNTVTYITPDGTPPVITPQVTGTLGHNGWYVSNVTVNWEVVDGESTITSQSGCNPTTINVDTTGSTLTCTATSAGGTASQSVTVRRDATAPNVSCGTADGMWHASNVSIACSAGDGTSGLANPADAGFNLTTSVASGNETANASTNSRNVTDRAGNTATAGPVGGNMVDMRGPSITISSPTAGTYVLNEAVPAGFSCNDSGSGVASCTGPVANGANLDTSSVGAKTFTVNAADRIGNTGTAQVNYNVVYNFSGFFSPVDNLPVLNTVKAGQAVPVKFSLGGNQGMGILASGYPKVQQTACDSSAPVDEIETVTAGSSGLQYDAATDTYTYVWKTQKAWAGTCRQLTVRLADGTDHVATFKLK